MPSPDDFEDENEKAAAARALEYMNLTAGTPMKDIPVDVVFLGSCTNSRIEDLRAAANIIRGRTMAPGVRMMVVPGSQKVRAQAEEEGLDKVFKDFGADWRFAGCSMCLGMNPDQLAPGSGAPPPQTAILRGGKAKADVPTLSHP
ncbi:3-isopropylmalate dehydratase large subunit [Rothia aeria]|uniref:3-isopropylmalate dehydratase n=1 Tax=Rothia aeria TaxID=172042 RepID=A0A2Z5R152_9MICC|nr:3-isopropylmalate dehydratase large subunit [Rothia aeria]